MSTRFAPAPNVEPLWEEIREMLELAARKVPYDSGGEGCAAVVIKRLCAAVAIKRLYLAAMAEGCISVLFSELQSILDDVEAGRSVRAHVSKANFLKDQDRRMNHSSVSKAYELETAIRARLATNYTFTAMAAATIAARLGVSVKDVEFCYTRIAVGSLPQARN